MRRAKPAKKPEIEVVAPFPAEGLPLVWMWLQESRHQVADDFSPATLDEYLTLEALRSAATAIFAVYRDRELGGAIWITVKSPVLVEAHCVFKRSFYGSATTIPALDHVAGLVFAAGCRKIEMQVFADNAPIRSLLRKLGAKQEGVLREQTLRYGRPVDLLAFGLLARDWQERRLKMADSGQSSEIDIVELAPAA